MTSLTSLSDEVKQYLIVTTNYWAFTLTDGALRMLVVLHFYHLGYSPLEIAMLFLFYEFFGVVTNLFGGWIGARMGLNRTMNTGLAIQIAALTMLLVPAEWLTVIWVMLAQALSGIAKDLNKMSAKSAIKSLVPENRQGALFKWVAILTGSKNALKGLGFFLGGALLSAFGFHNAVLIMTLALLFVWLFSLVMLKQDLGRSKKKPSISKIFSKRPEINILSLARLFLFGARDVWFVVALPVYFSSVLNWDHWFIGSFLALWIIGYGITQSIAPSLIGKKSTLWDQKATIWAFVLGLVTLLITLSMYSSIPIAYGLIPGLILFGIVFAINSSLHSYLIVSYADSEQVSMDVGFYYMANAMGRLIGTVLSGFLYQRYGLPICLAISTVFIFASCFATLKLPNSYLNQKVSNSTS